MKRITSISFFILLMAWLMPFNANAANTMGDVNGDNEVNIADVNTVINIILGGYGNNSAADVNGDHEVNIADVNTIINIILGGTSPTPSDIETFTVNGVTFRMVKVEGGTFTMGATAEQEDEAEDYEKPAHLVTLSSYYIGETEVTQELWLAVVGWNGSWFTPTKGGYTENLQRPVEYLNFNTCYTFIRKLNELTGKSFRLPTEAQWEYAARGGNKSKGYKYSGSNNIDDVAWHWENIPCHTKGEDGYGTQPVATRAPNELGIYDMSGNVWEWVRDKPGQYSSEPQTDPTGNPAGQNHIVRGGAWNSNPSDCRVSRRQGYGYQNQDSRTGFRIVLDSI